MPRTSSSFMMRYSSPSTVDLATGVLAEEHPIPRLHVERGLLAVVGDLALADRDDLPLLRLLLGAVRDDDAAAPRRLLLDPLEQDAVVERAQGHLLCVSHGASPCSRCLGARCGGGERSSRPEGRVVDLGSRRLFLLKHAEVFRPAQTEIITS